jgi:hypothetical protein
VSAAGGCGSGSDGRTGVDHLIAEVRQLDRELMVFLVTWLAAAHPSTAVAGLDAVRDYRLDRDRRAAALPPQPVYSSRWSDTGSGPGREVAP